ncbi:MAG: protein translocase subunit SecD [Patescibacteria group bacterium]
MKRPIILLIAIIVLAVSAGFFVYQPLSSPFDFLSKRMPWRLGLDLIGGTHLVYEVDFSGTADSDRQSVMEGLRDVMERRVNSFGISEPQVVTSKVGDFYRIIVELAGVKNPQEAVDQIGRTAFLDFREVIEEKIEGQDEPKVSFIPTGLTGKYLAKAQIITNELGQPQVALNFNDEGKKLFEEITGKNIGKPLAIFLDNNLISSPRVNEKIIGGNAVITGLNVDEATALVNLLNAGALPAPVNLVSQQLVGASLGEVSLKDAIYAGFIGTLLILIFMIFYYRLFGFFAAIALLIYIVLTLAVFKITSMTMTLSGIAGFILSIGMAVDANILIFERTKEEIKKGLSKLSAIEEGFRRAWPPIRDSNITTVISSIILYQFTTSFIKGFALALLIGVLVSMFSAITITKTILRVFIRK